MTSHGFVPKRYNWMSDENKFSNLIGKILTEVIISEEKDGIVFVTDNNEKYFMYHEQDCCETVLIEDLNGDIKDILNTPILEAHVESNSGKKVDEWDDSYTWTFYRIATVKGYLNIRWYGTSNGYYSEEVNFIKETNE